MPLLDTVSTGLPPELVHALNDSVTVNSDTGSPVREISSPGAVVSVYVDAVNGDDANSGLKEDVPLKTIAQVYRAVAAVATGGARIIVNLAGPKTGNTPVDYPVYQLLFAGHAFRGPEMLLAPVSTASAALDAGTPATSQTNRTRLNFTTAAPAWATNELRGYFVRIKRNGALQFPEMPIAENDGDHLWVNTSSLASSVLDTDTVEIVRPGANILGTDTTYGIPMLLIAGQHGIGSFLSCALERIGFNEFISTSLDTSIEFDRCRVVCPNGSGAFGRFAFVNTSIAGSLFVTGWVDNNRAVSRNNYASGKFVDLLVSSGSIVVGQESMGGYLRTRNDVSVYDSPGDAISCYGPASFIFANRPNSTLQGDGNTAVGIVASKGARVRLSSNINKTTITGSGGDLKVGTGPAISYGTGVGEFSEALGWNGNFTRVLEGTATAPLGDTSQIECVL